MSGEEPSPEEWLERIVARLLDAEMHEGNPHFAADHRQARITVALTLKGDALPFITASYEVHAAIHHRFGCGSLSIARQDWGESFRSGMAKMAP